VIPWRTLGKIRRHGMEASIVKGVRVAALGVDSACRMVLPLTRPPWIQRVIADSGCSAAGLGRLHQSGVRLASEQGIPSALLKSTETSELETTLTTPSLVSV